MKFLVKATCDFCKLELGNLHFDVGLNSAISQIKGGEFDDYAKSLVCPQHPTSDVICKIHVGSNPPDEWTKKFSRSKSPL